MLLHKKSDLYCYVISQDVVPAAFRGSSCLILFKLCKKKTKKKHFNVCQLFSMWKCNLFAVGVIAAVKCLCTRSEHSVFPFGLLSFFSSPSLLRLLLGPAHLSERVQCAGGQRADCPRSPPDSHKDAHTLSGSGAACLEIMGDPTAPPRCETFICSCELKNLQRLQFIFNC